jgi:hypothetical protein
MSGERERIEHVLLSWSATSSHLGHHKCLPSHYCKASDTAVSIRIVYCSHQACRYTHPTTPIAVPYPLFQRCKSSSASVCAIQKEFAVLIILPDGTVSELRRADPRVDSIGLGRPYVNLLGRYGVHEALPERVLLAPDDPDLVAVAARERSDAGTLDGVDIGRVQGACLDGHLSR